MKDRSNDALIAAMASLTAAVERLVGYLGDFPKPSDNASKPVLATPHHEAALGIAEQMEAHRGTMGLKELAEMLTISYDTVYKWVRECSLPATKVAGTYWIDPRLVARWWRNHATTLTPPSRMRRRALRRPDAA